MISKLFDLPTVYHRFHKAFSGVKIEKLREHLSCIDLDRPIRVIDLGCGPATNADLFVDRKRYDYLGIDINPKYIERASEKYDLKFECADATQFAKRDRTFDIVLINSVMHHLSPDEANRVLDSAQRLLDVKGECLVLDMVWPEKRGVGAVLQKLLIRLDRGRFCRTLDDLKAEISAHLTIEREQAFSIRIFGICLWNLWLLVSTKAESAQPSEVNRSSGARIAGF